MFATSPCCDYWLTRFSLKEQNTSFSQAKTPQNLLFYRTAPTECFQMLIIFLEREKQKNLFIPTEAVIQGCFVNKGVLKNFT